MSPAVINGYYHIRLVEKRRRLTAFSGIETFRIALLQLFDDGQYGDLVASDGIYTAIYRDFLSQGKYKMRFFANGDQGLARVSRSGYIGRSSQLVKRSRRDLRSQKKWAFDELGSA